MFPLSSMSMFKFTKWLHKLFIVGTALPLSDLMPNHEKITSVSGNVSLIRFLNLRVLFGISVDVELVA